MVFPAHLVVTETLVCVNLAIAFGHNQNMEALRRLRSSTPWSDKLNPDLQINVKIKRDFTQFGFFSLGFQISVEIQNLLRGSKQNPV